MVENFMSAALVLAGISIFIYDGLVPCVLFLVIAITSYYYTRSINRKKKIRIKEIWITDHTIKFYFFYIKEIFFFYFETAME